ncbi:ATPase P [Campylobacterota bacterium]|nr:ATPase P [Campylobacterota bacterium]
MKSASVSPISGSILVYYDESLIDIARLTETVQNSVPPALPQTQMQTQNETTQRTNALWSYVGYQLFRLLRPKSLQPFFAILGALPYFVRALNSVAKLKADVPLLDASAIGVSLLTRDYASASTLMMLLKTGEALEEWAKFRARENLAERIGVNVGQVWVKRNGTEELIAYRELNVGDHIVLRTGVMIPVDGTVAEGNALVNESSITGEPLGAARVQGDTVHAGSVIEEGEIVVLVVKKGDDTRFQKILQLVSESEKSKAKTELKAYALADRLVPFSLIAAGATAIATRDLSRAKSALSVDYSCAIKLATPLVFLSAMQEAVSHGVFFKGGAPMESFAAADTIVFDKTGTLTSAQPALTDIFTYDEHDQRGALKIAACLEEHFPHPVAKAIVRYAAENGVAHREEHSEVKYIAAHGIVTSYHGKHTVIGSRHFVGEDEGVDLSCAASDEETVAAAGKSALYLAIEGKLIGLFAIDDPPREEAAEVIAMLRTLGFKRVYLLSGDNVRTTERIAKQLGVDAWRGELLPNDKTELVRSLRQSGAVVAMVGDGINDSPALCAADVGIAMKDGTDLAQDAADISLREASLYPLVIARIISQRAIGKIRANSYRAIAINSALMLYAIFGNSNSSVSMWLHNLTTLLLSAHSMRPLLPLPPDHAKEAR